MPMPKGKFIDVDGVKTHFYEKGKGRPIVLVHGGNFGSKESSGNSWTWSLNLDALAKRYHVIASTSWAMASPATRSAIPTTPCTR